MKRSESDVKKNDEFKEFSLDDLKNRLGAIKKKGFIPALRKGNTGIGYTLEELLEIEENNLAIADFGKFELKASRADASTPITLFTLSPKLTLHKNWAEFLKEFGYKDSKNRTALKITLKYNEQNEQGFFFSITENQELFINNLDKTVAKYTRKQFEPKIKQKLNQLMLINADRRKKNKNEEFYYKEASLLKNPTIESFFDCLSKNYIIIEFRMHLKENGAVRDHGTAFRCKEKHLKYFYESRVPIM